MTSTQPFGKLTRGVALVAAAAILSGCASTQDGQLAQAQGAGIGAGLGALVGGVAGYAIGGTEGAAWGAGIGAAAGGAAGFAYGTEIAKRKEAYASHEQWMQNEIASARQENNQLVAYNARLEGRIAELSRKQKLANSSGDKQQMWQVRKEIQTLQKEVNQESQNYDSRIGYYEAVTKDKEAVETGRTESLSSVVNNMRSSREELTVKSQRLAALNDQLAL